MKKCCTCHEAKPPTEFYPVRRTEPHILSNQCIRCQSAASAKSRKKHGPRRRERERQRYRRKRAAGWQPPPHNNSEYTRKYCRDHPLVFQAKSAVRQALQRAQRWIDGRVTGGSQGRHLNI